MARQMYRSLFTSDIEAARTHDAAAIKLHGEFAQLSSPQEVAA